MRGRLHLMLDGPVHYSVNNLRCSDVPVQQVLQCALYCSTPFAVCILTIHTLGIAINGSTVVSSTTPLTVANTAASASESGSSVRC